MNFTKWLRVTVAVVLAVLSQASIAQQNAAGLDQRAARVESARPGLPLTAASNAAPDAIIVGYLSSRGHTAAEIATLQVDKVTTTARGMTHVVMRQEIDGLEVLGAYIKATLNADGELVQVIDGLATMSLVQPSRIDAAQALAVTLATLYPGQTTIPNAIRRQGNATTFAGGPLFYQNPVVTAVVLPLDDGTLVRGWLVETWSDASNQLHYTAVAGDGRIVDIESRTNFDSYNVFVEDPSKGAQQIVIGPGNGNVESPAGWLDAAGQTTVNISGNNANAYLDTDSNDRPDAGGSAVTDGNFLAVANLAESPTTATNRAVAVQNLFYLNNVVHDLLYRHGFNEAAGNFQADNFGLGGRGRDPVKAEAQDGGGTDNANFATPRDGRSPRMQMYLWSPPGAAAEVVVGGVSYAAYPSVFGPPVTAAGETYPLALVAEVNGMTDGCYSLPRGSLTGTIALVDRGSCNFTDKVVNAQQAGAEAVVIANNLPGDGAFGPGGAEPRVRIPSAMVSFEDGQTLRTLLAQPATLRLNASAAPMLDGDLDSDIVAHEYGHGLTWRMIEDMSGPLAGAIGEGASDVVAFLMNGDDRVGEYAYSDPGGIRRYPYTGYPLTYGDVTGMEVHNDGEIYAAAMWATLENYQAAGLSADDLMGDFVDGMNYTPSGPSFEQMRDGMLLSIQASPAVGKALRICAVWQGFAGQGIGDGATGTASRRGEVTITESFAIPAGVCPP
jgi:hypothetical protein